MSCLPRAVPRGEAAVAAASSATASTAHSRTTVSAIVTSSSPWPTSAPRLNGSSHRTVRTDPGCALKCREPTTDACCGCGVSSGAQSLSPQSNSETKPCAWPVATNEPVTEIERTRSPEQPDCGSGGVNSPRPDGTAEARTAPDARPTAMRGPTYSGRPMSRSRLGRSVIAQSHTVKPSHFLDCFTDTNVRVLSAGAYRLLLLLGT